jgi:transposase-like protein
MTKKHTKEFQMNAVRLATQEGNSAAQVALQLKIPIWKLRSWIRESKTQLERSSDIDELLRLHNENKRLKEEVEILKKAAAYFAKTLQ